MTKCSATELTDASRGRIGTHEIGWIRNPDCHGDDDSIPTGLREVDNIHAVMSCTACDDGQLQKVVG